jgi:Winged helix DNA-binding domain
VPNTVTLRDINRATLARQMLLSRDKSTITAAIERLVGLQAQVPRPPFVGLWSRVVDFERAQLTKLFLDRKVVRGTFLRGTIHAASAQDFLALRPVIQPALDAVMEGILRDRLKTIDLDRLIGTARKLFDKKPQTFDDLREAFLKADPKADERAMGYAVRMRLPLVQVPEPDEKWAFPSQACFALAEQWLGKKVASRVVPADDLFRRYLAAYGPATPADFQGWSGLPRDLVRETADRLRPALTVLREGKRELLDLPDAPRPSADVPAPVRFIPEYDNLITARADERVVSKSDRSRVFLSALRVAATVLVDGFAAGTWKVTATRKLATVTIEPFRALPPKVRKEIAEEAERLGQFSEPEVPKVDVKFGT